MSPEEYQQIKTIFQTAVELPTGKRADFLDSVCQGNKIIRRKVEELLNAENEDFMKVPVMARMAEVIVKNEIEDDLLNFSFENINIGESDRYKILSKIGTGGMGKVYLAQDIKLKRQVAIKFLNRKFDWHSEMLNRFIREAQAASALNHPNIIIVFEIKKHNEFDYIVSEYIEGETLTERMSKGKLAPPTALDIAVQIASALTATHDAGIIHRDIKPDNVMIRKDDIVKILDFGLAKFAFTGAKAQADSDSTASFKNPTVPGTIMGTPQYMSPEQAVGQNVDARTDIFSFGVVLYEMIAGNPPFDGDNPVEIIGSILKDKPPELENFVEDIPFKLKYIVNKTLRKDPQERYENTRDLLNDLIDLRDELNFQAKLGDTSNAGKIYNAAQTTGGIVTGRRFSVGHALVFLLGVTLIAAAFWRFTTLYNNNKPYSFAKDSPTTVEIVNWSSAAGELFTTGGFSPNDRMIAFDSTRSGTKSIWIKQSDESDSDRAIQITKDKFENRYPVWSPNGEEIAFFSTRGEKPGIWKVSVPGGMPSLVAAVADESLVLRNWAKSGKIYFESGQNLFALDTNSNNQKQLTDFKPGFSAVRHLVISQDERNLAYIVNEKNQWKIMVRAADNSLVREVVTLKSEIDSVEWHPDGHRLLFSALVKGVFQIFATEIEGGNSTQVTFGDNDCRLQDISTDGRQILFSSARESSNLWSVNLANSDEAVFRPDVASQLWGDVSPDNQTVVFQSIKNLSQGDKLFSGSITVKTKSADDQSIHLTDNGFLPRWSANGKTIAYLKLTGKNSEIWTVDGAGENARKITTGGINLIGFTLSPYNRLETDYYDWSPGSNEIVYVSDRNGVSNIWSASLDGSKDFRLTDHREKSQLLSCPIWSPDGKIIAYASQSMSLNSDGRKTRKFWIYNTETNKFSPVFETGETVRLIGWSANEEDLIFALTKTSGSLPPEVLIRKVSVETGEQKLLAALKDAYYYNVHLSPDRKMLAFVSRLKKNDDVWIANLKGGKLRKVTNNTDSTIYFSSLAWSPDENTIYFGKQSRFTLLSKIIGFE